MLAFFPRQSPAPSQQMAAGSDRSNNFLLLYGHTHTHSCAATQKRHQLCPCAACWRLAWSPGQETGFPPAEPCSTSSAGSQRRHIFSSLRCPSLSLSPTHLPTSCGGLLAPPPPPPPPSSSAAARRPVISTPQRRQRREIATIRGVAQSSGRGDSGVQVTRSVKVPGRRKTLAAFTLHQMNNCAKPKQHKEKTQKNSN